ncbi:undecaprenyl-phosphate 4-deoxy-4-formamido-L-arabinose transferase domain protein [Yersinia ruckeri ATCC 29473]|uniref:Polymyxin resistance protein ArnC, glycosyl transferase n=2 Tax=Yersinia ruckeri TaxID=29486 RepID=A0A0A8VH69_YERRU|nr:undecaprenyl-phosphate 4-deoxy-4-formamido-L-arabinose transferase domain protein [Yersinia ruckeri ATCC 29473]QTD76799.1 Undecaprenyl-phosphate 4-deoxy-4-formamido-L-arabinose transferase [Yersinia ruckeri]CEK27698.1 Polymyxin resistance protein ArnC, glycosyl transferase [Yersinia ruckeri]CNH63351.1 undecaprenyl phosphate 4-deoxy-4-formamido-L-arabinose transferase [Yersinia ruckeri]SUP97610.1 undecaprenyl phosphate 4-deoxy-4-formamido-L-arabinose transferase [Yersinia ruckeri]
MNLINLMYDLITCLTTTPLRLLSLVGSVIALSGFTLSVLLVALRLIFGPEWAGGGVFTLFALLFMFIGAQFVGMGLLGEYIGRIYNDVRARPRYFVQKVVGSKPADTTQEKE